MCHQSWIWAFRLDWEHSLPCLTLDSRVPVREASICSRPLARNGRPSLPIIANNWIRKRLIAIISKPGYYYITLFLFCYIIRIMTLLFPIMTLLYHLFFCKCQDYYFSLFHYLQKDYYITYDTSIISLIFIRIYYCYYCYYHTIICIIFFSDYYCYYLFRRLLCHLLFSTAIIAIMAIITLLFALFYSGLLLLLFFSWAIIFHYLFSKTLSPLLQLCP